MIEWLKSFPVPGKGPAGVIWPGLVVLVLTEICLLCIIFSIAVLVG
jgi:hypothetical protein